MQKIQAQRERERKERNCRRNHWTSLPMMLYRCKLIWVREGWREVRSRKSAFTHCSSNFRLKPSWFNSLYSPWWRKQPDRQNQVTHRFVGKIRERRGQRWGTVNSRLSKSHDGFGFALWLPRSETPKFTSFRKKKKDMKELTQSFKVFIWASSKVE